jgi:homocysteine S-methyltransferase
MGTILYERGAFIHRSFEELNRSQPGLVRRAHEEYVLAGADIIETNTFGANRFRLSPYGLEKDVLELNRLGVMLAREAADGQAWVAGAMGPLGIRIEPFGHISLQEARDVFQQQASALVESGVDLLVLETFQHLPELREAVAAVRSVTALPVVALIRVASGAVTLEGVDVGKVVTSLQDAGADVAGVNCSEALAALEALAEMSDVSRIPLCGQPNAGLARPVAGRNLHLGSPEYLVAWGRRAVRSGSRILGGCCGTRPEHIQALRNTIGMVSPPVSNAQTRRPTARKPVAEPLPRRRKSTLSAALQRGDFVTGVSLPPTRGHNATDTLTAVRELALAGVTFVGLTEGYSVRAYAPPLSVAPACRAAGVEPLVMYSCRGRRVARIQSDFLGSALQGVVNLLLVTGTPIAPLNERGPMPDMDIDSIGAINLAVRLNHGEDIGGNPIGPPTRFHLGIHVDPTAYDMDRELSRLRWKLDAGAEFALTAPIFDITALRSLLDRVDQDRLPIIGYLWPLRSAQEAEFFEEQLAAVRVPEDLVARMRAAEATGTEEEEGLAICKELAVAMRPLVQGIQVAAPGGRLDLALAVLDSIRS